ncbi:hypothetical protein F4803DRAFT_552533 [Xylaria telfairii]|nr:hypothetical protein F4803DRAFT_552533 [Xylaria telfairii]
MNCFSPFPRRLRRLCTTSSHRNTPTPPHAHSEDQISTESSSSHIPIPSRARQGADLVTADENTFHLFSCLHPELRLMVWEEFIRIPRIIYVNMNNYDPAEVDSRFTIKVDGELREQACPLLRVSRESRYIAMKGLFCFSLQLRAWSPDAWLEAFNRMFVIRSCDFLFFDGEPSEFWLISGRGQTDKIANIIIAEGIDCVTEPGIVSMHVSNVCRLQYTLRIKRLEKVYSVVYDPAIVSRQQLQPFGLDDLREFDPRQFPTHQNQFRRWGKGPGEDSRRLGSHLVALLTVWRVVSLG